MVNNLHNFNNFNNYSIAEFKTYNQNARSKMLPV